MQISYFLSHFFNFSKLPCVALTQLHLEFHGAISSMTDTGFREGLSVATLSRSKLETAIKLARQPCLTLSHDWAASVRTALPALK